MRILDVIHTWHPEGRGGSERHAREAALALQQRGHLVGVFTRTGREDLEPYEITTEWQGPISVTRVNNLYWDTPGFEWIYKNEKIHEAFARELAEFKPDLVHVHHLTGLSTTIVEHAKAQGVPVVMTLHDFWTVCPRGQRMTRDLELCETVDREKCYTCLSGIWNDMFSDRDAERTIVDVRGRLAPQNLAEFDRHMSYVLNLCDRLITPSEFHRERMLDFPLDPERIVSLPHGLDTTGFAKGPRRRRRPQVIGFIGSVIPVKGVHVLVDAFRKLAREDLSLVIHGEAFPFHEDEDYLERLKEQAAGLPGVRFEGAYEPAEVGRLLQDVDILVVPSLWWETYCLTIREGLLAGVPVVASDLGAMREALDGEQDGLLFRPGDADDLAAKLRMLLDDEELRGRYADRAPSVLDMETYVERLERLYVQTVAESAGRGLTVAPPSFPAKRPALPVRQGREGEVPAPLRWDDLGVAVRHHGPLAVSFQTHMPSTEEPALGLDITLRDGERDMGAVGVVVDLRSLERQLQQGHPREAGATNSPTEPRASLEARGRKNRDRRGRRQTEGRRTRRVSLREGARKLRVPLGGHATPERLPIGRGG